MPENCCIACIALHKIKRHRDELAAFTDCAKALTAETLADMCSIRDLSRSRSLVGMLGSESFKDSPPGLQKRVCVFSMITLAVSDTSKPSDVPMAMAVALDSASSSLGFAILVCLMFR